MKKIPSYANLALDEYLFQNLKFRQSFRGAERVYTLVASKVMIQMKKHAKTQKTQNSQQALHK